MRRVCTLILPTYFLKAVPHIQSLEIKSWCFFKGPDQLNALAAMQNLKNLKINYIIRSPRIIPQLRDVEAIKKLFQCIKKCEINFFGSNRCLFNELLYGLLQQDFLIDLDLKQNWRLLKLENFKY